MLKEAIQAILRKEDLSRATMYGLGEEILRNANPIQIGAFLALLNAKGETAEELIGFATYLLENCIRLNLPMDCLDIAGTGGDGSLSVNISTGSALLVAACGVPVAKHGNRSVSSQCGSADVLEALGIPIDMSPDQVGGSISRVGIGFIFAPKYHLALSSVATTRRSLGILTLFNLLAPLLNPARPKFALIGIGQEKYVNIIANCASKLGFERALIFHGSGLDELAPIGPIKAIEVRGEILNEMSIDPQALGFKLCARSDLQGGNPVKNAVILTEALSGTPGPISDALILNAGVALYIYGKCPSIPEGIELARKVHAEGLGLKVLESWIALNQVYEGVAI